MGFLDWLKGGKPGKKERRPAPPQPRKEGQAQKSEGVCAVPGCNNPLSARQLERGMVVCEACEAAGHHLCCTCGDRLTEEDIREGEDRCWNCRIEDDAIAMTNDEDWE